MSQFGFHDMQAIQKELQEKYQAKWGGLNPRKGRDSLLCDQAILENPETRRHFIEEMCDVMMYFNDTLLCYAITPEEVEEAYKEKHKRNMSRW